jgi:hypothetical protein
MDEASHHRKTATMPLDHCLACGGTDLYPVRMFAQPFRQLYLNKSLFQTVPVTSSVCLACGVITPRLEEHHLKTVRRWKQADVMTTPRHKSTESGQ